MAQRSRRTKRDARPLPERILDAALALAEEAGWEGVRLHAIAKRLRVPLAEVAAHASDLDAVADAWFARLRAAMLAPPPRGFKALPPRERLFIVLMRWFDAAARHRRVTGQMIAAKLYPSHPHHWMPLIFNLSRIIQWVREAALLDAATPRRQVEEAGLTLLFVATLAAWLADETEGQEGTRRRLRRRLECADMVLARLWPGARRAGRRRVNGKPATPPPGSRPL